MHNEFNSTSYHWCYVNRKQEKFHWRIANVIIKFSLSFIVVIASVSVYRFVKLSRSISHLIDPTGSLSALQSSNAAMYTGYMPIEQVIFSKLVFKSKVWFCRWFDVVCWWWWSKSCEFTGQYNRIFFPPRRSVGARLFSLAVIELLIHI